MINFYLGSFLHSWNELIYVMRTARFAADNHDGVVESNWHDSIKIVAERMIEECNKLQLSENSTACWNLQHIFQIRASKPYKWSDLANGLERLHGDTLVALASEYFCHYPQDGAYILRSIPADWEIVLKPEGFPSARREIEHGTDCYALTDYPGCIFHMTRVAELGLRALARERSIRAVRNDKPIEYAMWGKIIGKLHDAIDALRTAKGNKKTLTLKQRENRETAVEFYSTILGDLQALLPLRDRNAHFRDTYDRGQAHSAIYRTRSLMTKLASKLGEASTGKIRWGL